APYRQGAADGKGLMRKLLWIVLALAALYSGYWLVGSTLVERGLKGWLEQRRAEGWTAGYASLDVQGFPSRFDTVIEGLDLYDPGTGLGWRAPFFHILALS